MKYSTLLQGSGIGGSLGITYSGSNVSFGGLHGSTGLGGGGGHSILGLQQPTPGTQVQAHLQQLPTIRHKVRSLHS